MKGGRFWIGVVIMLLVGNAAAMAGMILTAGDPTPRVVPDYYRKAVTWDDTAAARDASRALGWSALPSVIEGQAVVVLHDAAGAPLTGAAVEVSLRHRSRADHLQRLVLAETAPGRYQGAVSLAQRGVHEVEVRAQRGDAHFVFATAIEP